jgi:isocitrate dehydrogenase
MNDKIKLFNEQAIKYAQESLNDIAIVNKSGIMYNYNDLYTEKFAELIVRECVTLADKESERYSNLDQEYCSMAMDNYRELVLKHFGVEE